MGGFYSRVVAVLACCAMSSGCLVGTVVETVTDLFVAEDPIAAEAIPSPDGPRIRPGVGLAIQVGVVGQPPTAMQVLVDTKGEVTMPHLLEKPIKVDGMTLETLQKRLTEEYSVYYRQPQVTVTFSSYDGQGISPWGAVKVLGAVGKPGHVNMPMTRDLTVMRALEAAGGFTVYADKTVIVWRCEQDGRRTKYKVDTEEIGRKGRIDKDMLLKAGDVVYVEESWF